MSNLLKSHFKTILLKKNVKVPFLRYVFTIKSTRLNNDNSL